VVERVLPHTAPFGASEHFGVRGQLIRRIDVVPAPHPLGYLPNMVFTQPPVEAILRQRAAEHNSVTVELGWEAIAIEQQENAAIVSMRDDAGQTASVSAKFVIACDGASSTVRRMMEIQFEDLGFDEPWLVVDILVNGSALSRLPQICAQYCDPDRPYTYIIGPGNHRRWEIMLNSGEDPRHAEREERVWQLLSRWLGPEDGELWRASSYRFHALVAERWQRGRVFLAGDAAHQQPPFLWQGMCQGVRDVTNLCWKMVSVLRGESKMVLLGTYEQERKLHVTTLTGRIKQIGASICIRDRDAAQRRDEELLRQGGGKAPAITRQEIVPPLEAGLVRPELGCATGSIFPQPRLVTASGVRLMDDVAGLGWRLILDGRDESEYPILDGMGIERFVIGGDGHRETEGVVASWFDAYGCKAAIVRPDHYVYCASRSLAEVTRAWAELREAFGVEGNSPRKI
jgi:3-(3-hydroxy-phenyl)propionate hydroxylase